MKNLTVIILTYNEEENLAHCLKSVSGLADEVLIVDSYSTDKTVEIAKSFGAKVFEHPFENQAKQFNWALENLEIKGDWILRLDADEYLTEELKAEIAEILDEKTSDVRNIKSSMFGTPDVENINGFYMKRRVYFMGRWMKHGGYYPSWFLRLWRKGSAKYEDREVDEHAVLTSGKAEFLKNDFVDENRKSLEWWIQRINNYTTREVVARTLESGKADFGGKFFGVQSERKKWIRKNVYYRMPLFCRAFAYFFYRYFLKLGFLDGKEGLAFHFLQGCWNQFLVDAKLLEKRINSQNKNGGRKKS
jgi:glycosyltransferase involved in cell wall biosynthesis